MIVAILGIGEAGGTFARDLIAEGVVVRGWDPEPRAIPDELDLAASIRIITTVWTIDIGKPLTMTSRIV